MASIQPLRGEAPPAEATANDHKPPASSLGAWLAGRPSEDRVVDLVAFALAHERELPATPESMARTRETAAVALAEYSLRHLHNRVSEIRQEAVLEQLGRVRQPAGFFKLLLANLLALALAAAAVGWLHLHPASWLSRNLAALVGLIPG
jgi:hypothetical protein